MVILYPSAPRQGRLTDVRTVLRKYSNIVYEKQVNIGRQGSVNLMRELYAKEDWTEANNGEGYAVKAEFSYQPQGTFWRIAPTQVYLMDFSSNDKADRGRCISLGETHPFIKKAFHIRGLIIVIFGVRFVGIHQCRTPHPTLIIAKDENKIWSFS